MTRLVIRQRFLAPARCAKPPGPSIRQRRVGGAYGIRVLCFWDTAKVASAPLGCATLWLLPSLPDFAWLMAQPEGQTGEPLSYQFQFVLCAHRDQSVDARLNGARVLHGDIKHLDAVVDHGLTPQIPLMGYNPPMLVIVPPGREFPEATRPPTHSAFELPPPVLARADEVIE